MRRSVQSPSATISAQSRRTRVVGAFNKQSRDICLGTLKCPSALRDLNGNLHIGARAVPMCVDCGPGA